MSLVMQHINQLTKDADEINNARGDDPIDSDVETDEDETEEEATSSNASIPTTIMGRAISQTRTTDSVISRATSNEQNQHEEKKAVLAQPHAVSGPPGLQEEVLWPRDMIELQAPEKLKISKKFVTVLEQRYAAHFKTLLTAKPTTRSIAVCCAGPMRNRNGVILQPPKISFDRTAKLYTIVSMPTPHADFLPTDNGAYLLRICIHVKKLKTALLRFFATANKIHFCRACGMYAWNCDWYESLNMCSKCVFEECMYSTASKSHKCSICQESTKRAYRTRCGHYFHRQCLSEHASINMDELMRCPNCRVILDEDEEPLGDDE